MAFVWEDLNWSLEANIYDEVVGKGSSFVSQVCLLKILSPQPPQFWATRYVTSSLSEAIVNQIPLR